MLIAILILVIIATIASAVGMLTAASAYVGSSQNAQLLGQLVEVLCKENEAGSGARAKLESLYTMFGDNCKIETELNQTLATAFMQLRAETAVNLKKQAELLNQVAAVVASTYQLLQLMGATLSTRPNGETTTVTH